VTHREGKDQNEGQDERCNTNQECFDVDHASQSNCRVRSLQNIQYLYSQWSLK
jgi:hypothetical protein